MRRSSSSSPRGSAEVVVGDPRDERDPGVGADRRRGRPSGCAAGSRRRSRPVPWLLAGGEVADGGDRADGAARRTGRAAGLWDEEIFGPVVAIRVGARSRDGVRRRSTPRATACTPASSPVAGRRPSPRSTSWRSGGVVVNEVPGFRSDVMPYGGVKDSGAGREGPRFAIEELTVTRMAVIRPTTRARSDHDRHLTRSPTTPACSGWTAAGLSSWVPAAVSAARVRPGPGRPRAPRSSAPIATWRPPR